MALRNVSVVCHGHGQAYRDHSLHVVSGLFALQKSHEATSKMRLTWTGEAKGKGDFCLHSPSRWPRLLASVLTDSSVVSGPCW
jgi:hypothetical protein